MAVEIGTILEGTVTGITNFGAFVDIGEETTGLVHISEVAPGYVKEVGDVLTVDDKVKVKVLKIENGKMSLSIKAAMPKAEAPETPARVKESNPYNRENRSEKRFSKRRDNGSLEDKISQFLKVSEEKLGDLKRNTEGKRGGRGGRRS